MGKVMDFGEALQGHRLSEGRLPFAPRFPFATFSRGALAAAAQLTRQWPEKRGILSHVVRELGGESSVVTNGRKRTIEAHFDAVAIEPELGDLLLTLGFEPDGFHRFVPEHFATHFTLKFKGNSADRTRMHALRAEVEARSSQLIEALTQRWPDLESYLEIEIYSDESRKYWSRTALAADWRAAMPFTPGAFDIVLPPQDAETAERTGVPLSTTKHADIHLKIATELSADSRESLLESLVAIGFYRVITWAGNDVCTAQFRNGTDARRVFVTLANYFDRFGGCSELTLEPVARVWRSSTRLAQGEHLGALPPLVLAVTNSFDETRVAHNGALKPGGGKLWENGFERSRDGVER